MKELIIQTNDKDQRLDKFLMKYMHLAPKSFIYKMLRKKRIKYNNKKAIGNEIINAGDKIQFYLHEETIKKFQENVASKIYPMNLTFKVIYEDENILICDKPVGLLVHPDQVNQKNTLLNQVLYYLYKNSEYNPEQEQGFIPGLCNRLDRNTSGLVIVGKNLSTLQEINKLFKYQKIDRYYMTVVKGKIIKKGELVDYYSKDYNQNKGKLHKNPIKQSKLMKTFYSPIKCGSQNTLLEVKLITGRTHQIRLHLSSIGHPIAGDPKYGDLKWNQQLYMQYKINHQLLHAYKIKFSMMSNHLQYLNGKEFISYPPKIFYQIME